MAITAKLLFKSYLEQLGLSAAALGLRLRLHPNRMYEILRGKRHITADTALRLERLSGIPTAEDWLVIQALTTLAEARTKGGERICAEVIPLQGQSQTGSSQTAAAQRVA